MVLTVKGKNIFAAIMGFCEVLIWYVVVRDAMQADGPVLPIAIAYASGYAAGTFIGGRIAAHAIKGNVAVQVITTKRDKALLTAIRDEGFAITVIDVDASEFSGEKYMLIANIDKRQLSNFQNFVRERDPKAFIVVQDTRQAIGGYVKHVK